MDDNVKKRRLGKGLSELLGEARGHHTPNENTNHKNETSSEDDYNIHEAFEELSHVEHYLIPVIAPIPDIAPVYTMLPIEYIDPNPEQPRKDFDEEELKNLCESIKEFGIIQPIMVTKKQDDDHYFLVAGERRWRAAQMAGLKEVPIIIKNYNELQIMEVSLIENIQRHDLNPLEEAIGYNLLLNRFELTQNEIASKMGKSRSHIANMLRLLNLPDVIQRALKKNEISFGHAKLLLGIGEEEALILGKEVIAKHLSVRELERKIDQLRKPSLEQSNKLPKIKDEDTLALEADLASALGIQVNIQPDLSKKTGQIILSYSSLEQLDEICKRLCQAIEEF